MWKAPLGCDILFTIDRKERVERVRKTRETV